MDITFVRGSGYYREVECIRMKEMKATCELYCLSEHFTSYRGCLKMSKPINKAAYTVSCTTNTQETTKNKVNKEDAVHKL